MKLFPLFLLAFIGLPLRAQVFAITDVTVVDTRTGALAPHRTVTVRDGLIASVETGRPDQELAVVDGKGDFLIPGLWDMVTHLSWSRESALPALVANGITAVRDEGGALAETAVWAEGVRSGRLIGPTIFQVGPMLNGKSFNRYQYALGSPDQAKAAVRLLKFEEVDGLEIERRVPNDVYASLIGEAKANGLPLGGKVPIGMTAMQVSKAGQSTIDNLETIYDGVFAEANKEDLTAGIDRFLSVDGEFQALAQTLRANGTAVTPCLSALMNELASASLPNGSIGNIKYVAQSQRAYQRPVSAGDLAEFQKMIPRLQQTVAKLGKAGVTILAGTDLAASRVPGFSLQDELKDLAVSGLTPLEVLQSATLNPATVMHLTAHYGTIEAGKRADMILLSADPTKDASALNSIRAVVLHGKLFDRRALDAQLEQAERAAAAN